VYAQGRLTQEALHHGAAPGPEPPQGYYDTVLVYAGVLAVIHSKPVHVLVFVILGITGNACKHGRLIGVAPSATAQFHLHGYGVRPGLYELAGVFRDVYLSHCNPFSSFL